MLLYGMLRTFGRPKTLAFCAALILATMASYWSNVRGVGEDALLSLGVTTALLAFYQAMRPAAERQGSTAWAWALFTAGMVIATLSKGVLGLAMPGIVIFVYLACTSWMDKRLRIGDWLRPALFTLLALVPLLIWLGFLFQRGGLQAVGEVLWTNSVRAVQRLVCRSRALRTLLLLHRQTARSLFAVEYPGVPGVVALP